VLPRMADAARWAAAAAPGLSLTPDDVLVAFLKKRQSGVEESVEGDPVATAILALASDGPWEGTVTDLLACLEGRLPQTVTKRRDWPDTVTKLGQRLVRLAPALRQLGVEVERHKAGDRIRTRLIS